MEALGVVLLFLSLTIVLPIVAVVMAAQAKSAAASHATELRALRAQLAELTARLARQPVPPSPAEGTDTARTPPQPDDRLLPGARFDGGARGPLEPAEASLPAVEGVAPLSAVEGVTLQSSPAALPLDGGPQPSPVDAEAATETGRDDRASESSDSAEASLPAARVPAADWEQLVGVRAFAWIGGGALFLAAALFLHYSIQNNLISPEVRVAVGLAAGALSLAGGDRLRHRTPVAGFALSGAGVAILYAALFSARVLYQLIGSVPAFAGMSLVTVTAGVIAVKRDAYFVALLGLVGGMMTPYLLASGEDRPLALFVYVALVSAGVLAVAHARRWASLGLVGLVLATAVFGGWAAKYLVAVRVPYALGAVAAIAGAFALARPTDPALVGDPGTARARALAGATSLVALLVAFVVPIVMMDSGSLPIEPLVLALYLIVLSGIAFVVSRRPDFQWLTTAAAAGTLLVTLLRVDADLFPGRQGLALACSSLAPATYFVWWLIRRTREEARSEYLAALILLSGALPIVVSATGLMMPGGNWSLLIGYAGLHAALLVVMAVIQSSGRPTGLGLLVSLLSLAAASSIAREGHELVPFVLGVTVFFFLLPAVHPRLRADRVSFVVAAAALVVGFIITFVLGREDYGKDPLGVLAIVAAALAVGMLAFVRYRRDIRPETVLSLSALFGALAIAFVTAAVPILLHNEWLTISWALEVAGLAWLHRTVRHRGLVVFAALLAAVVCIRLVLNPALFHYYPRASTPVFNHYLYTMGVSALAFFVAATLFVLEPGPRKLPLQGLLRGAATVFLFVLLNIEIADFYSTESTLSFSWSTSGLAEDMTYSLAWGAFALVLLLVGIWLRKRSARIGALLILVATMGKVFLHDLWTLGALYRVGSIVGLAVALLGVSFLTQRFILKEEAG